MSTHLTRLRRQCQPVQEDTPVPPHEHRVTVDKRDLLQLLADYDKACGDAQALTDHIETMRADKEYAAYYKGR